jgi:hypothetical protein
MRFGPSRWRWYDLLILGLAAAMVYPDKVVEWIGERTGKAVGWLHIVLFEILAITLMIVAMTLLMPAYPRLEWWYPLVFVGVIGMLRVALLFVRSLFGVDD